MNARLIKETRDLLPIFAGALPLIVVLQLIWPSAGFGYSALGVACVVMAGSAFGAEFQHRTLSLLLSHPIPRSVIWREKMLVLGAGMATSLAALLVCMAVRRPAIDNQDWVYLVLVPLCAFCGAPFWTLLLRHGIAGMVFAVGAPWGILAAYALVVEHLGGNESDVRVSAAVILIFIYCALVYWLGYAKFKRLEAVDGPARELSLPASLEGFFVRPLTKVSSRFRGPFATLLKKEFRLQQISFLLAGLFVLVAAAGACVAKRHHELAQLMVGFDYIFYVVILPLIAGAVSVAEEKGWGIAEWHLTLPPSALKQWSAKMLAALSTSLALGLLLPTAMFLAGHALFGHSGARASLPTGLGLLCCPLGSLLLTSVAVYAASFSGSSLRAMLGAVGIIAAGCGVCFLVGSGSYKVFPVLRVGPTPSSEPAVPVLFEGLFLLVCLTQRFAWSNFRRFGLPVRRLIVQLVIIFLAVGLIALAIVFAPHMHRILHILHAPLIY